MKSTLRFIIMALFGGAIGFFATHLSIEQLKPLLDSFAPIWLLLLLPLSMFAVILIHEVGHLVGGYANGFEFVYVSVLFLKLEKVDHRLKLSLGFNRHLFSWGGLAIMTPPATITRNKYLWFIAGGPLGSVTGALLCVVGLLFTYPHQPIIAFFCAVSLLLNGLIAVVTMMPIPLDDNIDTDGIQFFDLLRGGDKATRKLAMARLLYVASTNIRPADYPEELLQAIERDGEPDRDTLLAMLFRNAAQMDRNDWIAASKTIQLVIEHIEKLPPVIKRSTFLQATIIEGINKKASEAQALFTKAGTKGWADRAFVLTAEAAVHFAADHADEVVRLLQEAESQLTQVADPSSRMMMQNIITTLRQQNFPEA